MRRKSAGGPLLGRVWGSAFRSGWGAGARILGIPAAPVPVVHSATLQLRGSVLCGSAVYGRGGGARALACGVLS